MAKSRTSRTAARKAAGKRKAASKAGRARKTARKAGRKAAKRRTTRAAAPRRKTRTRGRARAAKKSSVRKAVKKAAKSRKRVQAAAKRAAAKKTTPRATPVRATKASRPAAAISAAPTPAKAPKAARPATAQPVRRPALDRERRRLPEASLPPSLPSSLDLDQRASAARSGRREIEEHLSEHTETGPVLTAGDVDANWESAYSTGDEAPGGDNPTPDQDVVDEIGRSLGLEYNDNEELKGADKVEARDRHRWELDPASSEDYDDRD